MPPASAEADVVSAILGPNGTDRIAALRNEKPEQIQQLQAYYDALFTPEDASAAAFSVRDRALVAVRVSSHTRSSAVADWYAKLAAREGANDTDIDRARAIDRPWDDATALGAAIRRADQITLDPASAEREDIDALKAAGLTPAGILSLSQVIAFVSYQVRFIAILRALGGVA